MVDDAIESNGASAVNVNGSETYTGSVDETNDDGNNNTNTNGMTCPYLDTIQRTALDFDFEVACSVTLQTGPHIYACLVCGRYFRGRGPHTPAYTHAVDTSHFVFLHLTQRTFHCLPDKQYRIRSDDPGLADIQRALHPTYTTYSVAELDRNRELSRDLFGRLYRPGFVGLNNLRKTDGINSVVQALAHVRPLRDYFLLPSALDSVESNGGPIAESSYKSPSAALAAAAQVTRCFTALVRQMWSNQRFKSQVDPHRLVQAITVASHNKYRIGHQLEVGEFMAWLLHQLHLGSDQSHRSKKGSNGLPSRKKHKTTGGGETPTIDTRSIIQQIFQGKVRVTTRQAKRQNNAGSESTADEDDRGGSDDETDVTNERGSHNHPIVDTDNDALKAAVVEESIAESHFLQLTLDLTEKPLFRDQDGGLVIPQEPLVTVLQKFDGVTVSDTFGRSICRNNGKRKGGGPTLVPQKRTYQLLELPDVLILHFSRFPKYRSEDQRAKNPTIVVFPVKNLNLTHYVASDPTVSIDPNDTRHIYKYDLVANIVHDSPADVGREGTSHDPLQEGSYKCHVQHYRGGNQQWYEIQDLHVQETMPQQIGVSESYLLILERAS